MFFSPRNLIKKEGRFVFKDTVTAVANKCLCKDIFPELWFNHTYRQSTLITEETDELIFKIGDVSIPYTKGELYAISISESGICVKSETQKGLINGFMTLIDRILIEDFEWGTSAYVDACEIFDSPKFENRMIHYCIFPDTDIKKFTRMIKLTALLKYSHVIIEFWGTIKFDVMKELAWESGYSKEEIRPVIELAKDLGLEVIPMFNHWGHASASRVIYGKHVVLDQNPALQTYFNDDGWCWAIEKPKVRKLLKSIREELCELFGDGDYFHIGCDEAYNFKFTKENQDMICDYINSLADELESLGRRTIIWGDMFVTVNNKKFVVKNDYIGSSPDEETQNYMLNRLDRKIVIADWQYNTKNYPVESAVMFKNAGLDTLICPWDRDIKVSDACVKTLKENGLFGLIHTTWSTLDFGMPYVGRTACCCWDEEVSSTTDISSYAPRTAAVLRKAGFAEGSFEDSGWY